MKGKFRSPLTEGEAVESEFDRSVAPRVPKVTEYLKKPGGVEEVHVPISEFHLEDVRPGPEFRHSRQTKGKED